MDIVLVVPKNGYSVKDSFSFKSGVSIAKITKCYRQIFPKINFLINFFLNPLLKPTEALNK